MQRIHAFLVLPPLLLGFMLTFIPLIIHAQEPDPVQERLFKVQLFLAKGGDPEGQYYLAEMYEKGLGTPQDMKEALNWYKKSADLGNNKAIEKVTSWEKNQTEARKAKERSEAEARAADIAKEKQLAETATKAAQARVDTAKAAEMAKARQQAEAEAAAKAKAKQLAEMEAAKAAEMAKARQQAEAEAAAKAKATDIGKSVTKPTPVKTHESPTTPVQATGKIEKDKNKGEFTANPCKGPQAKFLSTC